MAKGEFVEVVDDMANSVNNQDKDNELGLGTLHLFGWTYTLAYDGEWQLHMLATCIVFILEDVH